MLLYMESKYCLTLIIKDKYNKNEIKNYIFVQLSMDLKN